jgi:hypothetical protein
LRVVKGDNDPDGLILTGRNPMLGVPVITRVSVVVAEVILFEASIEKINVYMCF